MTDRSQPPVILAVDDDAQVLDAVATDLRDRYGATHRVVAAPSGDSALTQLEQLTRRGMQVAVVVTDQRMPGMSGTDLLVRAKELQPHLRSVLLTAYADTDAAIQAINEVSLDHYVLKPWDPPEEHLYPVVDELLEEWEATRPRPDAGLRVVGDRWSAPSHRLRDYLARNRVPFRWIDVEHPDAKPLLAAAGGTELPMVLLDDGRTLADPTPAEVSSALTLSQQPEVDFTELVVVGAGPAGLAAAVYGASEGLKTLVIEAEAPGGQAGTTSQIENYLGFPSGISGSELSRRAEAQARRFGAQVVTPHRVVTLRAEDPYRVVVLDDGTEIYCSAVIVATGVQYRRLESPGVEDLTGAGVYYGAGAVTEAADMADARVVVVGGANSAGQAALKLAESAREVVLVMRASSTRERMSSYLCDRISDTPKITVQSKTSVASVSGTDRLEQVTLDGADGPTELDAQAMFIFIGASPMTTWLDRTVVTDDRGFIVTGPKLRPDRWALDRDPFLLETSLPGVFAVGDVRATSIKRVASAVGEGSVAVQFVHQILNGT